MTDWHALVAAARRRGDHLAVIDLARQALDSQPGDARLEYEKTLAYARAGATGEAEANLDAVERSGALASLRDEELRVDFAALRARLLKDRALAAPGEQGTLLGQASAEAYEAIWRTSGAFFPAINAAALACVYGDASWGKRLAEAAIAAAQAATPGYWRDTTMGEGFLLLGDLRRAEAAFRAAASDDPHGNELATTRRQVAWLCRRLGIPTDILEALPAPEIVTWDAAPGHEAPARVPAGPRSIACGAIVSPADVAIAEAFIAAGASADLVIACERAVCVASFGGRFGAGWGERLDAVLTRAQRITEVTLEGDSAEPVVAALARLQARGLANMRAASMITSARTLTFGDCAPAAWRDEAERVPRAFVFGDMQGFSRLSEAAHRPFLDCVIGGFAEVLESLRDQVEYVETAGDGLFVVLSNLPAALRCCDGLQRAARAEAIAAAGLPAFLGLRLGAHVGPVARGLDRVTGREKFIGKEVIRTARIEAVTPVGHTYVTEQFAATLHAVTAVGHACEYVGWQAMAKGFGHCRMYALRPTPEIIALLA